MRHGIPEETKCGSDRISLRAKIWKILLCVYELSASQYAALVSEGACWQYEKIENDAFRTLATDKKFREQVHEASILRVLNSFVLKSSRENGENAISYVQGMNALLAPFLYVMPELDAFHSFEALVTSVCPTYVQPTLEGVYTGLKLLGKCLKTCDPPLHSFLAQKNMDPALYALPSVLTLCACTPPLEEVLKLWDYYLCFGAHLNIVAVLSQIIAIRSTLMASDKPMNMLRVFQPIDSQRIIKDINIYLPRIPKNIRESLHLHTHTQVRL